jgi:hypothetical protein
MQGQESQGKGRTRKEMVGTARFELATPCTPSKCATRLRYVPMESAAEDDDDSVGLTSKFYTSRQRWARTRDN